MGIWAWGCVIAWAAIVASLGYRIVMRRGRNATPTDWACIGLGAVIGSAISPLWYPASGVLVFDGMDVPRTLGAAIPGGLLVELLYRAALHPGRTLSSATLSGGVDAALSNQMSAAAVLAPPAPVPVAHARPVQGHANAVVSVDHLRKVYGQTVAVDEVSLSIGEGEIFGIIGPNGAGKTTTVESISGLRRPDGGRIAVFGLDPGRDRDAVRHLVGVQLQESRLPARVRVRELLDLFASFYPHPADPGELLDELGLAERRGVMIRNLSGGQKQRLSIALALIGNPKIAILDELTTGLDPQARRETWQLIERIRGRGVTVILVTHYMDEAERLCDRLALIDHGRVVVLDTPGGIAESAGGGRRMRFRPSGPIADGVLRDLAGISSVEQQGDRVAVTGPGDLLGAVTTALAAVEVRALDVEIVSGSLEDAFLNLTRREPAEPASTAA